MRRYSSRIRLGVIITIVLVVTPANSQQPPPASIEVQKPEQPKYIGAEKHSQTGKADIAPSPAAIINLTTNSYQPKSQGTASAIDEKSAADWWMVKLTGFLGLIGALQLVVFGWQAVSLRQTIKKMDAIATDQTKDMAKSIAESARSASAMEGVAASLTTTASINNEILERQKFYSRAQMRAYVSISVGSAIHQERSKNLKFEATPIMLNSGHTPAHRISYWANSAILPVPLPDDFAFILPKEQKNHSAILGPHQTFLINSCINDFIDDADALNVMRGEESALYIWGRVDYEDEFREPHFTRFCISHMWIGEPGKMSVRGYYIPRFNSTDWDKRQE